MKEQRNPFLFRTAENIEGDPAFVRFFGPGALELLRENQALVTRVFFSAAGGGKTSLMRLFTPGPLLELHKNHGVEGYSDLYEKMRGFDVMGPEGPRLLGVPLGIGQTYSSLADIGLEPAKHIRLLYALLDARMILSALHQARVLRRVKPEGGFARFALLAPDVPVDLPGLTLPCDGDVLYGWARKREDEICAVLDSFNPTEVTCAGSDGLITLDLLKPDRLLLDGRPVAEHILFLFDDVQHLSALQHERLFQFIITKRSTTPVWLAERLEALTRNELLSLGSIQGRDYERVYLETYWRDHPKRFEAVVNSIAERRARGSRTVEIFNFEKHLEDRLDATEWSDKFTAALQMIETRVRHRAAARGIFDTWIAERERFEGTPRDRAIAWRELEILIERESRKKQTTLDFPLESGDLEEKSDSSLRAAAELFLANEFDLPYYYGPATFAKLSSSNIQQYLGLTGKTFEEIISAALINPQQVPMLSTARQEAIVQKSSQEMWDEIPRRARQGARVRALLEAIAQFSRWYTDKPSAPNDPGVNAIAITMADRNNLMDPEWIRLRPEYALLAEVLASALTHNYLDAQPNSKCKGQFWCILNLNRLLCARYHLPLNYGKFKEQKLETLVRWMNKGFEARRESEEEML